MKDLQLIEDYLHGQLSEEEMILVERKCISDEKFRELLDLCAEIDCAISEKDVISLREQLGKDYKLYKFNKRFKKIGLIIVGVWLIWIGLILFDVINSMLIKRSIFFVLSCFVLFFFSFWNKIEKS